MLWEVSIPNEWSQPHYYQSYIIITILFEWIKSLSSPSLSWTTWSTKPITTKLPTEMWKVLSLKIMEASRDHRCLEVTLPMSLPTSTKAIASTKSVTSSRNLKWIFKLLKRKLTICFQMQRKFKCRYEEKIFPSIDIVRNSIAYVLVVLEKYHYYLFPFTSEEDSWGTKALDLTLSRNLASPYLDSTRKVKKAKAELMMYPQSFIFHFQRGSLPYFITNKLFMRSACKKIRYEETKKADRVGLKK